MAGPRTLLLTLPRLDRGQAAALFDLCAALQEAVWTTYEPQLLDEAMARSVADAKRRQPQRPVAALTGQEAYALIQTLESATRALWAAHGDAIADYLACVDPEVMEDWVDGDIISEFPHADGDPDLPF
jgi:hypothetical protein